MNPRIISAVPKNTIFMLKISPLPWGMKPHIRGIVPHAVGDFLACVIYQTCEHLQDLLFMSIIRNSSLLLIKSQTKSTLLKAQNPSKP